MGFYKQVQILIDHSGFSRDEAVKHITEQKHLADKSQETRKEQEQAQREIEEEIQSMRDRIRLELDLAVVDLKAYKEVNRNDMHVQSALDRLNMIKEILWNYKELLS